MGGTEFQRADSDLLRAYLARGDAPCPACGYNLRGVESAACPECGSGLSLSLQRRRPLAGWLAFLLLAFGWVFVAGSMNATRGVVSLVETKRQMEQAGQWRGFATLTLPNVIPPPPSPIILPSFPPLNTSPDSAAGGADEMQDWVARRNAEMQSRMDAARQQIQLMRQQLQLRITPPTPAAPVTVSWQSVWAALGTERQIGLIWAGLLVLGGALGLLLLAVLRGRSGPRTVRRLGTMAAALFVLYAGWHLVLFGREMAGL